MNNEINNENVRNVEMKIENEMKEMKRNNENENNNRNDKCQK